MTAFDVLPWSLTTMYAALKEKSLMKTRLMRYAERPRTAGLFLSRFINRILNLKRQLRISI